MGGMLARMIVCTDVDYRPDGSARAAALLVAEWSDAQPLGEWTRHVDGVEPYLPGEFFRRELPCLLAVLEQVLQVAGPLSAVVIDGYVTLDAAGTPGLGAHLYAALGEAVPVIGVAKTAFRGSPHALAVCRGGSRSALYVTAVGMEPGEATRAVQAMAGPRC